MEKIMEDQHCHHVPRMSSSATPRGFLDPSRDGDCITALCQPFHPFREGIFPIPRASQHCRCFASPNTIDNILFLCTNSPHWVFSWHQGWLFLTFPPFPAPGHAQSRSMNDISDTPSTDQVPIPKPRWEDVPTRSLLGSGGVWVRVSLAGSISAQIPN